MSAAALLASRKAIVFDLDGTLADTVPDLWLALNSALAECGLDPVPRALVLRSLHGGLEESAAAALQSQRATATALPALLQSYSRHYRQRAHAASALYAGVPALLAACRQRGHVMAVCTNKGRNDALALLARLGIAGYFANVTGGDTAGHAKPHPAPLLHALLELQVPPAQALLIGDSHVDALCAARAHVNFMLHGAGYGGAEALRHPAAARFLDYRELV